MLWDLNGIKLEINNENIAERNPKIFWEVNNILLSHIWNKEEILREILKNILNK